MRGAMALRTRIVSVPEPSGKRGVAVRIAADRSPDRRRFLRKTRRELDSVPRIRTFQPFRPLAIFLFSEIAMTLATAGQLVRIAGLSCELVGIVGIWYITARGADAVPAVLNQSPDFAFKALIATGFVLWLIGRTLIMLVRNREPRRRTGEEPGRGANDLRF